jgi:hypothetical protein
MAKSPPPTTHEPDAAHPSLAGASRSDAVSREHRISDVAKPRTCLRCSKPFHSTGFGNRICGSCTASSAWRSGVPMKSPPRGRKS